MTIYDIASALNISPSTVSRVANNKSGVRRETRQLVLKYMEEHNYVPNITARNLVNQSTKIIGILIADVRTAYHAESAYHIQRELNNLGYCCIIFNTGSDDTAKAEHMQILSQRRVEAVVLIGSTFQCDLVEQAIQRHLRDTPVFLFNGHLDLPNVYSIMADEQNGVTNCVRFLAQKGRKHPAFLLNAHTPSNDLKQFGYEIGVRSYLQMEPLVYEVQEDTPQGGYEATLRLMQEHPETDSLIYSVDLLAVSGLRALSDLNIRVPDQVSVMGVDNSMYAQISIPRLTSLDNKLLDMSMTTARMLIDALSGKPTTRNIMILSDIQEREST